MRGFLEALRFYTSLDFLCPNPRPLGSPWEAVRWLPAIGLLLGCMVSWVYLPVVTFLLPADVAIAGAICLQVFLMNFQSERGLWEAVTARETQRVQPVAVTLLVLGILLKFLAYRQFLAADAARALVLGTTAALVIPITVGGRTTIPQKSPEPPLPAIPTSLLMLSWLFLTAVVVLVVNAGNTHMEPLSLFRAAICVLACVSLVQLVAAGLLYHPAHPVSHHGRLFGCSLAGEVAAVAGFLIARSQAL